MIAEFFGTFMFLFFAFVLHITATANQDPMQPPNTVTVITIAFAYSFFYGFWLLINALILRNLPGGIGMFNPAVTLGLVFSGAVKPLRALLLLPMQILGGVSAAAIVKIVLPYGNIGRVATVLAPTTSITQGLFLEMFFTSLLVIMAIIFVPRTGALSFMAPLIIGIGYFVGIFLGLSYTEASLNPVRSFAPCAVIPDFPGYHYIYWVGPLLGAVLSGLYSQFARVLRHEPRTNSPTPVKDQKQQTQQEPPFPVRNTPTIQPAPTPPIPSKSSIRKTVRTKVSTRRISPGEQSSSRSAGYVSVSPGERSGRGGYRSGSGGYRSGSQSGGERSGTAVSFDDKDEIYPSGAGYTYGTGPPSPYQRTSSEYGEWSGLDERHGERRLRRSSGKYSDMSRYERAREYDDIVRQ